MSDPEYPDSSPDENTTEEGMEVRTRRVRKRKKRGSGASEGKSILTQGKELLEKMQMAGDEESQGHVGVAEQMRRLQKDEDDEKPLDEVWGTKKRSVSWLWVSLLGIILPLVVIGFALKFFNEAKTPEIVIDDDELIIPLEIVDDKITKEGPLAPFYKDSMTYLNKARKIINLLSTAKTLEELEPYIRYSHSREDNPIEVNYWDSPMMAGNINDISWHPHVIEETKGDVESARGVVEVRGRCADQTKYSAYFIFEGHEFLLDWDATTGWSEISFSELRAKPPRIPKGIRCLVDKKAMFDRQFDQTEHSGYLLIEPGSGEFIFAYIPLIDEKRKKLDQELREVLQYGRFVMSLKHDQPVKIKVRSAENGRFEIVGFEHEGWVDPKSSYEAPPASTR